MKQRTLIILVVIALLLVAASSASARAGKTEFMATGYVCVSPDGQPIQPGKYWFSDDGIYHARGWVYLQAFKPDNPDYNDLFGGTGLLTMDLDWRDYPAGDLSVRATWTIDLGNGGWAGTIAGRNIGGEGTGVGVGHGTGVVDGMQVKFTYTLLDPIPSENPCSDLGLIAVWATRDSVRILDPHGD